MSLRTRLEYHADKLDEIHDPLRQFDTSLPEECPEAADIREALRLLEGARDELMAMGRAYGAVVSTPMTRRLDAALKEE